MFYREVTTTERFSSTPDNLNRPWLYYEAGAIAAKSPDTIVCPFLVGLAGGEIQDNPFNQLQWTNYDRADTLKLIHTINGSLPAPHNESLLSNGYVGLWPTLKRKIDKVIADNPPKVNRPEQNAVPVSEVPLSPEARTVLLEGSRDQNGLILVGQDHSGFYVQANGKDVCMPKGARNEASYRAALNELLRTDLIDERNPGVLFGVTDKGFKTAENFEKTSEPKAPLAEPRPTHEAATPPGKIKDYLHKLGVRGRAVFKTENEKKTWWESLPSIVRRAVLSRQFNLFMEIYQRNDYHG